MDPADTLVDRPGRLLSLDAFRGATVAAMFLVNNQGDWSHVFAPLKHADWNGFTPTDLVFPFFLFIMGAAMSFSLVQRSAPVAHVFRRVAALSALNAVLALVIWGAALGHFRFYGVLQRIAFCYLFAALVVLQAGALGQSLWAAGLLAAYALILRFVPVPGHGAGSLDRFSNIVDYVDSKLMLPLLYEIDKTAGVGHDPEGLISTLGAISTTLCGALCGRALRRSDWSAEKKTMTLLLSGFALLAAGFLWSPVLPLNKNLWTPSYVLVSAGWAFLGLALFYWLIDARGFKSWAGPFVVYGKNAIAAYVGVALMSYVTLWIRWEDSPGHIIRLKTCLYQNLCRSWISPLFGDPLASAAWGAAYVILWWFLMRILYRKRIFIKI